MIHTNRYAGLMSLYTQIQNAKYHRINPAEIFNSRLHDSFVHMEINGADITGIYSRKGSTITIPDLQMKTEKQESLLQLVKINCHCSKRMYLQAGQTVKRK